MFSKRKNSNARILVVTSANWRSESWCVRESARQTKEISSSTRKNSLNRRDYRLRNQRVRKNAEKEKRSNVRV